MCMEEYVFVRRMGIFEMPFTRERTLDNKLRRDSSNQVRVMWILQKKIGYEWFWLPSGGEQWFMIKENFEKKNLNRQR